ncbi:tyrosine-type recombinase/integrase [Nonomuraea sp. LPB2021202275-12-8]|uniref:tyrosine-type recombinase/integrase n=1 Tax=Nonomuraea sp. LPB2021202275-12-8 TaxID=3120159 RepID=UPI00300D095A
MAHIQDRWMRKSRDAAGKVILDDEGKPVMEKDPERFGKGARWRVRYMDPDGQERNRSFAKKVQADRFKVDVEADVQRGTYIDPDAGKVTFRKIAEEVIENRTLNPSTRAKMRQRLTKHVYPLIGSQEIGLLSQRPSIIQSLVKQLSRDLSPTTLTVIMAHVQLVFSVAISDKLIVQNPVITKTVVLPSVMKKKLVPWTADQVFDVADALPARYQAMVEVGTGVGLRQGEIFAFSPDDIDWLPGVAHIQRQVKILSNKLVFAPPKGGKPRDVPLPESVKIALAEHMRAVEPVTVTLPWVDVDGPPHTAQLFFTNVNGRAIHQATFLPVWRRALVQAGIVPPLLSGEKRGYAYREHGMHMLRHYFASVLLTEGESPKAVADWLGHGDGGALLLRTYAHLMPKSEQRMRKIIDAALRRPTAQDRFSADGPETARGVIE